MRDKLGELVRTNEHARRRCQARFAASNLYNICGRRSSTTVDE
jgi:hypothetical protein